MVLEICISLRQFSGLAVSWVSNAHAPHGPPPTDGEPQRQTYTRLQILPGVRETSAVLKVLRGLHCPDVYFCH